MDSHLQVNYHLTGMDLTMSSEISPGSSNTSVATPFQLPFELESLSQAVNYQKWIYRKIAPYLGNRIMEVGAGIGNMSKWLPVRERLILTEYELPMLELLSKSQQAARGNNPKISVARLDLDADLEIFQRENLDTIISFNVLEHIQDDEKAVKKLYDLLRMSTSDGPKRLVTLVPAHSWAYGSMDKSFGHFRRYSKSSWNKMVARVIPGARVQSYYFNSFGLVGWVIQGRLLGKSSIGKGSIATFETLCPFLSPIDDFLQNKLRFPFGQSLLTIIECNS